MRIIKSVFGKLKSRNIIFVFSLILCVGVISLVAFSANEISVEEIKTSEVEKTESAFSSAISSHNTSSEQYELSSAISTYKTTKLTSSVTAKKSAVNTSKKSVSKAKKKTTSAAASKKTSNKTKAAKTTTVKPTVRTTTIHKVKKPVKKKVTTTTVKKVKKKKKKKTTTVVTTTTATKAYTPSKAKANTYDTRDISQEKYTIKNVSTGKKVKSDGFDLLCQIVNGEVSSSWNAEAIKAQAVAAYSHLRYCKANSITPELGVKPGYDSRIESIVKSVEGLICTYNDEAINAVFCASSAGCTADVSNVWGGNIPYLKSVDSKYDEVYDPNYGLTKTMSKKDVKKILQKQGVTLSTKKKKWIKATSHYNGKYVGSVSIDGKLTLTGDKIRSLMGLKSAAFTVSYSNNSFTFTTYGYGHGVGMSQWGAQLYASKGGYKFDQILKHYYSGIKISL